MAAPKKQISVGIDIGNTNVVTIVISHDSETGDLNILGYGHTPVNGMRRGMVVNIEETIASISNSLEEAERMSGVPIDHAVISISGQHTHSSNSRGVVAVSRSGGEIHKDDIDRVIDAAKAFSMPANREVVHIIPRTFIVDDQDGIKDPLGMKGIRLEVDAHVIIASSPVVKNLLKCAYQAGVDVDELVLAELAASRVLLTHKQKEIGVVLVDIGGGDTNIAVFEEGEILHTASVPVGASHITNDIAIGLKTSIEIAEKIKVEYGVAHPKLASERDSFDLADIDQTLDTSIVNRKYIAEIINARLEELFSMVKDELRKIGRDGLLPVGAVITGGGSQMPGVSDVAKEILRLPAQLGEIAEPMTAIDKKLLINSSYATAIGLAIWGLEERKNAGLANNLMEGVKGFSGILEKLKIFFKKD